METVRYGIVGLGNQGSSYTQNIFMQGKAENAVLTALCDCNPKKIDAMKAAAPELEVTYFTDFVTMLESGLVDAVLIEVPHYQHPDLVMECLKRDIHVICEKPAGVYAAQVKEMNAAAAKSKALFGMMFNQRTNCLYRKMRQIIQEGKLGKLQRVTWIITNWYRVQSYFDCSSWRATWEGEGGGVLINQCPHQLDLVQWVVGKLPKYVNGFCRYGQWHDIEAEDDVTAYFEYDDGATGMFITTTGEAPGTNRFEVSGSLGKLLCENNKLYFYQNDRDSLEFIKTAEGGFGKPECTVTEVETDGENPQHAGIINNFTAAILGTEPLFVSGTDGLAGVELMNAIEYSGWNGGIRVQLPVDENAYLQALNEHRKDSHLRPESDEVFNTAGTYGSK